MPIRVFLSSSLRRYLHDYDPGKGFDFDPKGEITVGELCRRLNVPQEKIKIVMVNGKASSLDRLLKGEERVALFPPVGGG